MIPTLAKTDFSSLKSQKDNLIDDIVERGFGDFDPEGKKTWKGISDRLFPAVKDLFSSLIDSMEKNENALHKIIEQQRQTITQQGLNQG
jgi:hypothetical protein